jgi:hypothetical protein
MSLIATSYPASAATWAIPEPISPAPNTHIFLISIVLSFYQFLLDADLRRKYG